MNHDATTRTGHGRREQKQTKCESRLLLPLSPVATVGDRSEAPRAQRSTHTSLANGQIRPTLEPHLLSLLAQAESLCTQFIDARLQVR